MTQPTSWSVTVKDLANEAGALGIPFSERLEQYINALGPCPTRPAGFVMTKANEDRWIGNDIVNRTHIITPVWTASTNSRSIDLWTMREPGENEARLTPQEAIQLATDLLQLAHDALASDASENEEEGK